jgi:hypothetical protein
VTLIINLSALYFTWIRYLIACHSYRVSLKLTNIFRHVRMSQIIYQQSQLKDFYWCCYLSLYHYMFRPPRAILMWIQYITLFINILERPSLPQRIRCFKFVSFVQKANKSHLTLDSSLTYLCNSLIWTPESRSQIEWITLYT